MRVRDENLEQITNGYLKDLQHFREMFIRKDLYPEEEYYEVTNYDIVKQFEPHIQDYIKQKMLELGSKYVKIVQD